MKQKDYQKMYFINNRERLREKSRLWYQKNKERGKEINLRSSRKIKLLVLEHYSNGKPNCECCKECEQSFLTIDHINNDGAEHRRTIKRGGGVAFYYWLKLNDFPKGFQVLCFNCNHAKSLYGKCPHKN